jgi:hypothetical protein
MRNFWICIFWGVSLGAVFGVGAFFVSEEWHPYRWWLVAYMAVASAFVALEWRAIRWIDRHERWQG